jgi:hypothetical protein
MGLIGCRVMDASETYLANHQLRLELLHVSFQCPLLSLLSFQPLLLDLQPLGHLLELVLLLGKCNFRWRWLRFPLTEYYSISTSTIGDVTKIWEAMTGRPSVSFGNSLRSSRVAL